MDNDSFLQAVPGHKPLSRICFMAHFEGVNCQQHYRHLNVVRGKTERGRDGGAGHKVAKKIPRG